MPSVYLKMPTGWIGLGMTIIVYVCMTLGRAYFKTRMHEFIHICMLVGRYVYVDT